jgi:hypothetical protein
MAGSLNHLIDDTGAFKFSTIENMGDAYEACEQCFDVIALLIQELPTETRNATLSAILGRAKAPRLKAVPVFGSRRGR